MKLKDVTSITITAKDGVMHFEDDQKDLKYYGVKCVYDQKNDAELCDSICHAIERLVRELLAEGIVVDMPKIGEIDKTSEEYKYLQTTNHLARILKAGSDNKLRVTSRSVSTEENGSNMVYSDNTSNLSTWAGKMLDFAYNLNISKTMDRTSSFADVMGYVRKRQEYKNRNFSR